MSSVPFFGSRGFASLVAGVLTGLLVAGSMPLHAQETRGAAPPPRRTSIHDIHREEVLRLEDEIIRLRHALADARIAASDAERQLAEVLQFMNDHDEYGDDFQRYHELREIAKQDARRQATDEARKRRLADRDERRARAERMRRIRDAENAEQQRIDRYRQAGFAGIGEDVFVGRVGFAYKVVETGGDTWVDYDPLIGYFTRPGAPRSDYDYSRMTISGSVLNASEVVRNIGIAITFFDAGGNQVGGEIVKINAARPDVPYPFTSTIEMAIDTEFTRSSMYVLYADPVQP